MDHKRLDLLLLERQLASTRSKAQELIASGKVSVGGKVVLRAGEKVPVDATVALSESESPYVSRGGTKLAAALAHFRLSVKGARVLDVGQSTGGFTHALLLHGASLVVGVEGGSDQLAPSLRSDSRVECWENQDIRRLQAEQVAPSFTFFTVDLAFISLTLVLPVLPSFLSAGAEGIVLVKPQFEVGPDRVGSGGIVRNAAAREWAVERVRQCCKQHGFTVAGVLPSPILGGNREFLLHLTHSSGAGF